NAQCTMHNFFWLCGVESPNCPLNGLRRRRKCTKHIFLTRVALKAQIARKTVPLAAFEGHILRLFAKKSANCFPIRQITITFAGQFQMHPYLQQTKTE
ncbi:MAG: hypothetical protein IKR25_03490, partial [Muribaculaceae bacterium]|nr:hypothetical protein [Muribaculaceae bacterium]